MQALAHAHFVRASAHHLDIAFSLPHRRGPDAAPPTLTCRTLDGLLESPLPLNWDEKISVLKATGRLSLDPPERDALSNLAGRFPLLA